MTKLQSHPDLREASYQAVEPSEGAQPLKTNYTSQQLEKMPKTQAHGGSTKRSVPLGQTLAAGAEDQTNGPFKEHRVVSYYGHPNSKNMGILGEYSPVIHRDRPLGPASKEPRDLSPWL
ncbi:hypothetical protein [Bacillus infantis]|uniref:hypothetical protein n=1 Tax=Bacillus infantis TaxID=324767 RepID=UPI003CED0A97